MKLFTICYDLMIISYNLSQLKIEIKTTIPNLNMTIWSKL